MDCIITYYSPMGVVLHKETIQKTKYRPLMKVGEYIERDVTGGRIVGVVERINYFKLDNTFAKIDVVLHVLHWFVAKQTKE